MGKTHEQRMLERADNAMVRVAHAMNALKTAGDDEWAGMTRHPIAGPIIKKAQRACGCGRDCGLALGLQPLGYKKLRGRLVSESCYREVKKA